MQNRENDSTAAVREMYWDEDNRLMVLSDNGKTSRYTYNHAGERAVKSHGSMEGVYINGAPQGITFHETDEYTLYPASIISVNKNRFTKHYFIGDKRVASRIGSGSFNNVYGQNGSFLTAGQQDYAERLNQIETQREDYYKKLGIAPGIPTMKGSYGDPENTGVGYNTIIKELGDHTVPAEWAQYVKHNEAEGSTPGAPIQWDDPSDPESALPGYGFIADNSTEEETFYYHSDHLGSTSYITDKDGNITQYDAYLPYGELLVDEHSSSEDLPYKFNGKELDEETGLYYYGARYMQPMASIWYGVDQLTEKKPNLSGYVYCIGNPIRLIDPDGNWEWDKSGNLVSNAGDNEKSLAKFLNTDERKAYLLMFTYRLLNGNKKASLPGGVVFPKDRLYVMESDETGVVVHNTKEAVSHYYLGHGEPADVGDESTAELLNSSKFIEKHNKITKEKVAPKGYFNIDLTCETFHIGHTNVEYEVKNNKKSQQVKYTLFSRDGFWDPDFIDENILGKIGLPCCIPDGKGPNLERGGTPYDYKTRTITYFYKPVAE